MSAGGGAGAGAEPGCRRVRFLRPTPDVVSGGTAYDEAVLAAWPGPPPTDVPLRGAWPDGPGTSSTLAEALRDADDVIVDGLVGAAHPGVLGAAQRSGTRLVLLVHLPLADETGLAADHARDLARAEGGAVALADVVVATSRTTADDLRRRYGRPDVLVAPPGVDVDLTTDPAGRDDPRTDSPPLVLCLASLTPRKNHVTLLRALALLDDPWTAVFAGPGADADRARLDDAVAAAGFGGRVALPGVVVGEDLEALWRRTDVLVLPSLAETYGMVVTEAIAHGVPVVVAAGTGAVEALTDGEGPDPGVAVDARSPRALADGVRRVLCEPGYREAARGRRTSLRRWSDTARVLAGALARVPAPGDATTDHPPTASPHPLTAPRAEHEAERTSPASRTGGSTPRPTDSSTPPSTRRHPSRAPSESSS